MASGGLSVMTPLVKLMLMWLVDSWDMLQPLDKEMLENWGKLYYSVLCRAFEITARAVWYVEPFY